MSGREREKTSAKPAVPRAMDFAMAAGSSEFDNIFTLSAISKPSASMALTVIPKRGERCIPVTRSRSARPGLA